MAFEVVEHRLEPRALLHGREDAPLVPNAELTNPDGLRMRDRKRVWTVEPIRRADVVDVCAHPVDIFVSGVIAADVAVDLRLLRGVTRIAVDDPRPRHIARPHRAEDVDDASPSLDEVGSRQ